VTAAPLTGGRGAPWHAGGAGADDGAASTLRVCRFALCGVCRPTVVPPHSCRSQSVAGGASLETVSGTCRGCICGSMMGIGWFQIGCCLFERRWNPELDGVYTTGD
jgi:hypothetical protein